MTIQQVFEAWHQFFHQPVSLFPLALFRVLLGVIITLNAIFLIRVVPRHLAVDAIFNFPRYERSYGRRRLNLLNILPASTTSVYWILFISGLSGVLLSVGLWTHLAAAGCYLTLTSLHHRNPSIFHGGDTVLRIMSFLLMFSPAGSGWSADAMLIGNWEATADPWCWRLMQLQISMIYLRNVMWKLRGERWRNGTAAWYPMHCAVYTRFPLPKIALTRPMLRVATWGTLLIEFSLGSLVWIDEFRWYVTFAGIGLHLTLEYVMNLQLMGWTMIACLLLFL